jgi:hypothetical protein
MGVYPLRPYNEKLNSFLHLEDLVKYKDKVIERDLLHDFVVVEFKDGKALLIYPWVEMLPSVDKLRRTMWPNAHLDIEHAENLKSCRHKKKWWQFWRT